MIDKIAYFIAVLFAVIAVTIDLEYKFFFSCVCVIIILINMCVSLCRDKKDGGFKTDYKVRFKFLVIKILRDKQFLTLYFHFNLCFIH